MILNILLDLAALAVLAACAFTVLLWAGIMTGVV
jgi:hypothetical protein